MKQVLCCQGRYDASVRPLTRVGRWVVVWLVLTGSVLRAASLPGRTAGSNSVNPSNVVFTCRGNEASAVFDELWQQGGTRVLLNSVNYWRPQVPVALRFRPMSTHDFVERTATGMECRVLWAHNGKYAVMGDGVPDALLSEGRTNICSSNRDRHYKGMSQVMSSRDPRGIVLLLDLAKSADTNLAAEAIAKLQMLRAGAVCALGGCFTNELAKSLESQNLYVRKNACEALGVLEGEPRWFLIEKALASTNADVRCAAAETLGDIRDPRAVTLLERLLTDSDENVCKAVILSVGKIGNEKHVPFLAKALADEKRSNEICYAAIQALGKLGGDRARELLEKMLTMPKRGDGKFFDACGCAAVALAGMGGERDVAVLEKQVANTDWFIRCGAIRGLGSVGGRKGLLAIEKALRSNDLQFRNNAAIALGKIAGENERPLLEKALHDDWRDVRIQAVKALSNLGGAKSCALLAATISDKDTMVRVAVATALGRVGGDGAVEALGKMLNDQNGGVRYKAVYALGNIGGNQVRDLLCARVGVESDLYVFDPLKQVLKETSPDDPVAQKALRETPHPHPHPHP